MAECRNCGRDLRVHDERMDCTKPYVVVVDDEGQASVEVINAAVKKPESTCRTCRGGGFVVKHAPQLTSAEDGYTEVTCPTCRGTGKERT